MEGEAKCSYFILDTAGGGGTRGYGDVDYVRYLWETNRFNKVNEGDWFVYRRPGRASETRDFYFFGAGRIGKIVRYGTQAEAYISQAIHFDRILSRRDLESFNWELKARGTTWEHFFNQYGMTEITREDFINLLVLGTADDAANYSSTTGDYQYAADLVRCGEFAVEDATSPQKRRIGQRVFSTQVKLLFSYRCVISSVINPDFLVASHIVPWAVDKSIRLDPQNGLCLAVHVDKAFDKGYLGIDEVGSRFVVRISKQVHDDPALATMLLSYDGQKLTVDPSRLPRMRQNLRWHLTNVFRDH